MRLPGPQSVKASTKLMLWGSGILAMICLMAGWWWVVPLWLITAVPLLTWKGGKEIDAYWNARWREEFNEPSPWEKGAR
jgi:hypothetical protein